MAFVAAAQSPDDAKEEKENDSTHFLMFTDPNRAVFKLGESFYRSKRWYVFERGLYPIEISARYRVPVFDTLDLSTDRLAVVLAYDLEYTPEAASFNRRMTIGAVPLGASFLLSSRQFTWLLFERQGLTSLANEIEQSTLAVKLEKEFANRKVVYNYNRLVFGLSNAVLCWSTYRLYKLRKARLELREERPTVVQSTSLFFNPFYDPKFNACGTSLVFSF